jgi:hypothetical protein
MSCTYSRSCYHSKWTVTTILFSKFPYRLFSHTHIYEIWSFICFYNIPGCSGARKWGTDVHLGFCSSGRLCVDEGGVRRPGFSAAARRQRRSDFSVAPLVHAGIRWWQPALDLAPPCAEEWGIWRWSRIGGGRTTGSGGGSPSGTEAWWLAVETWRAVEDNPDLRVPHVSGRRQGGGAGGSSAEGGPRTDGAEERWPAVASGAWGGDEAAGVPGSRRTVELRGAGGGGQVAGGGLRGAVVTADGGEEWRLGESTAGCLRKLACFPQLPYTES